jgi:uncharacterized repeat protein (TIGR03803 family)
MAKSLQYFFLAVAVALHLQAASLTVLYNFSTSNGGTSGPQAPLVQGSDGGFYGTSSSGGGSNQGTVFEKTPAGALATLVSFNGANGAVPDAGLVLGSDGNFYGTTSGGGSNNQGTVFKLASAGGVWTLSTLVSFNGANGANPYAGLVQGSDGNFYGTTLNGGGSNDGTVFEVTPAGVLTTLFAFTGGNGANPYAGLVQGSDGNFYGTTFAGGGNNDGTIFSMTPSGSLTTLVSFGGSNGVNPYAGLVQGSAGDFYGTTSGGGSLGYGVIFQLIVSGNSSGGPPVLTSLVDPSGQADGRGLVQMKLTDANGNPLANTSVTVAVDANTISTIPIPGDLTSVNVLTDANGVASAYVTFNNSATDVLAATTQSGTQTIALSINIVHPSVAAPVFSLAAGTYATAQTVTITSPTSGASIRYTTDGSTPTETNGNLYSGPLTLSSTTTLAAIAFESGFADSPVTNGTYTIDNSPVITSVASFSLLYSFTGNRDGFSPSSLIQGTDGRLYGTAPFGGTNYDGIVFAVNPNGTGFTAIYSFTWGNDGGAPQGGLIQGTDGRLYGTTQRAGANGAGTVFAVNPDGTGFTTLCSFASGSNNNRYPYASLVQGTDGRLYGTTYQGGANGYGTVYAVTTDGTSFTTLYSFANGADGSYPQSNLIQGSDGRLYGTASGGGANGNGTVFAINPDGTNPSPRFTASPTALMAPIPNPVLFREPMAGCTEQRPMAEPITTTVGPCLH